MSTSTAPSVRCPRCSAHLRAGSDWCSLCYADLRPAPEPPPTPVAPPASVESPEPTARPRGRHARRAPASEEKATTSPDDVEVLAAQMLAELAASEQKSPLGPMAGLVDSTQKKVGLMVGGAVAAMCVMFIVMFLLGSLF